MNKINNIAKNTSYFTSALILQKIISFSFFIILAKFLLPEDLGKYYFAISFTTIFAIFIDLGLANVLTREVAKTKERAEELLGSVLVIKIPLTVLSVLAVFLIINLMNYPEITRYLVYLSVINMVLDSFTLTFFSIIRGFHNLIYESIASVIFQLIALTFGILALKYNLGLLWLMMALVFASIYNFFYSLSLVRLKFKLKFRLKINKKLIKTIIYISIPFGIYGILQRLYMYLDTVFLSIFAGDHYVGLYQVSFKVIFALQFLPMAFMAALYPAFSAYWKENREQLVISFERAMSYLIVISIP
ncbi:MAG: flippase, partial [Patescibacteria group bacterium]